ncbi:unnamed protein product [Cuscuta epithymum]|uniref:DUF4216 domain-containing protein n=1 Tax=Cuscuta epithymum TaxID=186058 RepID=A0AAV0ETF2_9ASTE|nr:unnamed protein product [Cuscuta epithymum]
MNCPEILPFYHEFIAELSAFLDNEIDAMVDSDFVPWFKYQINSREIVDPLLVALSWGPGVYAKVWRSYVINGYNYHTVNYGQGRSTVNNGLCVPTIGYDNSESNFFGVLHDILEFEMPSAGKNLTCVLFSCKWVDPTRGVRKNSKYNMIDVNHSRVYRKNEPFILAQQATQVYYAEYPSIRRTQNPWVCACAVRPSKIVSQTQHKDVDLDAFQQQFC